MADAPDLGSGPERVGGSSPPARTNFFNEIDEFGIYRTVTAQNSADTERPKVRFPKVIRYRRVEATIYGKICRSHDANAGDGGATLVSKV